MINNFRLLSIKDIQKSVLKSFDCGIAVLNEFLLRYALKNDRLGIGKTFVALDETDRIEGYFTLATAQVAYSEIPDDYRAKLPKYPIPALRIARLSVDKDFQKKGVGKWLLSQAFVKTVRVAEVTGLYFILVDAKESSRSFYEHYGFQKFNDEKLTYFILLETIRKAMQG